MTNKGKDIFVTILAILGTALAISAIFALFDDDSGKIVSKKGLNALDDDNVMDEIDKKIKKLHGETIKSNVRRDVVVNLDQIKKSG